MKGEVSILITKNLRWGVSDHPVQYTAYTIHLPQLPLLYIYAIIHNKEI